MLASQAIETALGLAVLFFVVATAASSLLELGSRLTRKRARDFEEAVGALLSGKQSSDADFKAAIAMFKGTTVYGAASALSGRRGPAYLSAKSFADAVIEISQKAVAEGDPLPEALRDRLNVILTEVEDSLLKTRASLERWFDEGMDRARDAYSRFSSYVLFVLGVGLAAASNASAPHVAAQLWIDPVTRSTVTAAAEKVTIEGTPEQTVATVASLTNGLSELGLPVGWETWPGTDLSWWASHVAGWIVTGLFVMLGAPFWFDLLTRLVSIRGGGRGPAPASQDPASATSLTAAGDKAAQSALLFAPPGRAALAVSPAEAAPKRPTLRGRIRSVLREPEAVPIVITARTPTAPAAAQQNPAMASLKTACEYEPPPRPPA